MNINKIIIFQTCLIPFQGHGWLEPLPIAYTHSSGHKVGPHLRQDTLPSEVSLIPTLKLGQFRHASLPHVHISEYLEKTHADMGKMCKLHTDSGPTGNWLFSFIFIVGLITELPIPHLPLSFIYLISVIAIIAKACWTKWRYLIFEDLLYPENKALYQVSSFNLVDTVYMEQNHINVVTKK